MSWALEDGFGAEASRVHSQRLPMLLNRSSEQAKK